MSEDLTRVHLNEIWLAYISKNFFKINRIQQNFGESIGC